VIDLHMYIYISLSLFLSLSDSLLSSMTSASRGLPMDRS
jgi:hypothetical protein